MNFNEKNKKLRAVKDEVPVPASHQLRMKFQALQIELKDRVLERDEVIKGVFIALLCRLNIFLLGLPGTAKSYLTKLVCAAITGAGYFEYLMTKGTKLEEIFGALRLSLLDQDRYVFNTTNRLPTATIAFLDEIWKSCSAILNALLKALNEHEFVQDGVVESIPLQTCFSASNELPEDASLDALYDRFLLRYEVGYIQDEANFKKLVGMDDDQPLRNQITLTELAEAQAEVKQIDMNDVPDILAELRASFGQVGMTFSDRRWRAANKVLRASAWLRGSSKVEREDTEQLIAIFWDRPEQKREVKKVILSFSNPDLKVALELFDQAVEIYSNAMKAQNQEAAGIEANKKMKEIIAKLNSLMRSARRDEIITEVKAKNRTIMARCCGMDS